MKENEKTNVWIFYFTLEREDGADLKRDVANRLFEKILEWAESNNCQIGGGYRVPKKEELE